MAHNNNSNSPLFEKFYELRGFDYNTPNLKFYNLHLNKEALHNSQDLPLYGMRAPPLKTSTFLNLFSLVVKNILGVGKFKSSIQQFFNDAKMVKAETLYDVLSILTYNHEYERLADKVKITGLLRDEIIRPIDLDHDLLDNNNNFRDVMQALRLGINNNKTLGLSDHNCNYFIEHFPIISRLVNITLKNVYYNDDDDNHHNLGALENINNDDDDSIRETLDYLTYICLLNNDCNQMIICYKNSLCSFNKLMTTDETSSLPIIVYLIVYSYKLLWIGASFLNVTDDEERE